MTVIDINESDWWARRGRMWAEEWSAAPDYSDCYERLEQHLAHLQRVESEEYFLELRYGYYESTPDDFGLEDLGSMRNARGVMTDRAREKPNGPEGNFRYSENSKGEDGGSWSRQTRDRYQWQRRARREEARMQHMLTSDSPEAVKWREQYLETHHLPHPHSDWRYPVLPLCEDYEAA